MANRATMARVFLSTLNVLQTGVEHIRGVASESRTDSSRAICSAGGDGGALETRGKAGVFRADFFGEARAEFLEELCGGVEFRGPIIGIHAQQFIERIARDGKALEIKRAGRGDVADG